MGSIVPPIRQEFALGVSGERVTIKNETQETLRYTVEYKTSQEGIKVITFYLLPGQEKVIDNVVDGSLKVQKPDVVPKPN
jgi:hypothetical protein